jgi:mono/diheme cytochrome c family protein
LVVGFPLLSLAVVVLVVLIAAQGGVAALQVPTNGAHESTVADAAQIQRGAYLARIGDCIGCHSVPGGPALAGGRAFATDWGTVYSTNLSPDPATGLGDWSAAEFRHAMKHGVSRRGLLYPVFPFQHFQHVVDADLDAIFAWLQQQTPVPSAPPPTQLDSIAGWRAAMLIWRMAFHRPTPLPQADALSPSWQRGRYLVEGLGHCAMCHGRRGAFGALIAPLRFAGARIPQQGWVAPALDREALSGWDVADLAEYLRAGVAPQSSAFGPMADVVHDSTQYLSQTDAEAMAEYLLSLAPAPIRHGARLPVPRARETVTLASTALYEQQCADCHGKDGRGQARVYPPLAGNTQVTAADPVNLIRIVLIGAAAPSTQGNPEPHSMPPFVNRLSDAELIEVLNHVRGSWGNDAAAISQRQIDEVRALSVD